MEKKLYNRTIKNMREMTDDERLILINLAVEPTECTCSECNDNEYCKYVFDPYNSYGDCLIVK
jgi:hypothetical protein